MTNTAKRQAAKGAPHCSEKRVPQLLEVTRSLPEHWETSEEVGAALAAVASTGAGDDDEEKTT